ncbi:hypothetical protein ONZ45_g3647 [Pleurotus djamor]|nr:hypothetical protein ONZ45_g3647 [Pleurotus djamor]
MGDVGALDDVAVAAERRLEEERVEKRERSRPEREDVLALERSRDEDFARAGGRGVGMNSGEGARGGGDAGRAKMEGCMLLQGVGVTNKTPFPPLLL